MTEPIIRVENLSKRYRIDVKEERPESLREATAMLLGAPFRYLRQVRRPPSEEETFWALKDVSFEVKQGEVVGIIGRNGAGKSTLLKILSRITDPTSGRAEIHGRIASLLEVGTGFHPELTGRENIYLNGAILGMKRAEIAHKFDEIVDFSGVEQFVDTPVKRYSSGMYVRLAFAVAAHLEPEILLVDEVLAVGDAAFQKKCLGKMGEVAREGRTVLFVSHNMTAVSTLCTHGISLGEGKTVFDGSIDHAIDNYLNSAISEQVEFRKSGLSMLRNATLVSIHEALGNNGTGFVLEIEFEIETNKDKLGIDLIIKHGQTSVCFASSAYYSDLEVGTQSKKICCLIGPVNFSLGRYSIDVQITKPLTAYLEEHVSILQFDIDKQISNGQYHHQLLAGRGMGFFVPPQKWFDQGETRRS